MKNAAFFLSSSSAQYNRSINNNIATLFFIHSSSSRLFSIHSQFTTLFLGFLHSLYFFLILQLAFSRLLAGEDSRFSIFFFLILCPFDFEFACMRFMRFVIFLVVLIRRFCFESPFCGSGFIR